MLEMIIIWKPDSDQIDAARSKTIPDVLARHLEVLWVGINPSLYSAAVGHHFARPGNRFWPALFRAGFTERLLSPFEDRELLRSGCGLTNVVDQATSRAEELTAAQVQHGVRRLVGKVQRYQPGCVAFLGITTYRIAFGVKSVRVGLQPRTMGRAAVWLVPNPSGLNAHYQLPALAKLFSGLRHGLSTGSL